MPSRGIVRPQELIGIPPALGQAGQFSGVESDHDCLTQIALAKITLAKDFNTVGWVVLGRHVNDEPPPNSPPTWLFSAPLEPTARPGKLFTVKQPATRTDNPVAKMTTGTRKVLPCLQWMVE